MVWTARAAIPPPLKQGGFFCRIFMTLLSKEEINKLPLFSYEGKIQLVKNQKELHKAMSRLEKESVIGFDTESRPSFRKGRSYPTTLIQLAGSEIVVLIPLRRVPLGTRLLRLLANPEIIKAGVAIREDMSKLRQLHEFEPAALADLAEMAHNLHVPAHGLRTLAANIMGGRISKSVQCSNWATPILTPQQIKYAATDAWVGRELYLRMCDLGKISLQNFHRI